MWDSGKELAEYEYLLVLQKAGKVKTIELQPKFGLQPAFTYQGKKKRAITYKADFRITMADGREIIVECKGFRTRSYQMRKKMLLHKYPELEFKEIT